MLNGYVCTLWFLLDFMLILLDISGIFFLFHVEIGASSEMKPHIHVTNIMLSDCLLLFVFDGYDSVRKKR